MIRFNPNRFKALISEEKKDISDTVKVASPKAKSNNETNPNLAEIQSYANKLADFSSFVEERKFETWAEQPDEFRENHTQGERSTIPLIDWKKALNKTRYWKDFMLLSNGEFNKISDKDLLAKNWTQNDWKLVTETLEKRFKEKISEVNEKIAKNKALNLMILS